MFGRELLNSELSIANPAFIMGSNFVQYLPQGRLHE